MDGLNPFPRRIGCHNHLPGKIERSEHARWWEDAFSKTSMFRGATLNMTLVPSHPCAALPYVNREQPKEPATEENGKTEAVLGRDVLPGIGMRVQLNESGIVWAKAYDKKFKTNYWDDKMLTSPLGTIVSSRKGCCAVQWDCGNRDFRVDNNYLSYFTGDDGCYHLSVVEGPDWSCIPVYARGHNAQTPLEATKLAQRIACIKRMFSFFDEDGSGEIDIEEFGNLLRMVGLGRTHAQIEVLFKSMDKDGSGEVSEDEFIETVLKMSEDPNYSTDGKLRTHLLKT